MYKAEECKVFFSFKKWNPPHRRNIVQNPPTPLEKIIKFVALATPLPQSTTTNFQSILIPPSTHTVNQLINGSIDQDTELFTTNNRHYWQEIYLFISSVDKS